MSRKSAKKYSLYDIFVNVKNVIKLDIKLQCTCDSYFASFLTYYCYGNINSVGIYSILCYVMIW